MTRWSAHAGLTYLELLVSLALFSIMIGLVAGTLDFGRRAWERTESVAAYTDRQLARQQVRRWLEWANFRDMPPDHARSFIGGPEGFSYRGGVTNPAFPFVDRVVLSITAHQAGERFTVQWSLGGASPMEGRNHNDTGPMAADLQSVKFSYYGRQASGQDPAWHGTWPTSAQPPELIKIEAVRSSGRPWPPLVIAPRKALIQREISVSSPLPPG